MDWLFLGLSRDCEVIWKEFYKKVGTVILQKVPRLENEPPPTTPLPAFLTTPGRDNYSSSRYFEVCFWNRVKRARDSEVWVESKRPGSISGYGFSLKKKINGI
jgi:hypothetical protein